MSIGVAVIGTGVMGAEHARRSVVETARRRSLRALEAIRLTFAAKPLPIPA